MSVLEPDPIHHRAAALSICVCLTAASLTPGLALAAPSEDASGADADGADDADEAPSDASEAEAIFRRGQAKYETADYNGAIELWTEAYGLVDSTPENASIKALLIFNLAQAHTKAYDLDEDLIHLRQAKSLLLSFRDNLTLLYADTEALEVERARVDDELAEIEVKLAAEAEPEAEPPPAVVEPEDQTPLPPAKPGKPLIIAGGAILGVGVAAGVVGIIGGVMGASANDITDLEPTDLLDREDRFASGRTGNVLLIIGAVGAGVLLPTGAALVGVGVKRNSDRRSASLRVSPTFAGAWGSGGGLTVSGQF